MATWQPHNWIRSPLHRNTPICADCGATQDDEELSCTAVENELKALCDNPVTMFTPE